MTLLRMAGAGCLAALGLAASTVSAQTIERNLPPPPAPAAGAVIAAPAIVADNDATPLGATLRALVLIGSDDPVALQGKSGVTVAAGSRLAAGRDELGALRALVGQPVSRRLITQARAAVVAAYRRRGFPFVSVTVPEQEVSGGVLNLRIAEFRLDEKRVAGASPVEAERLRRSISVTPGAAIDGRLLAQEIDWLNRYPFRRVDAAFTPGTTRDTTTLDLSVKALRPFSLYAGYASADARRNGSDRLFVGGQSALPLVRDGLAAYQFTSSADPIAGGGDGARYRSHAGRLNLPTGRRQEVEATLSSVRSREAVEAFDIAQATLGATLSYRTGLSNIVGSAPGVLSIGVEARHQRTRTSFGATQVRYRAFDIWLATAGYGASAVDRRGRTDLDVAIHVSPGGIGARNTTSALAAASDDRVRDARYVYLSGSAARYTSLSRDRRWALSSQLIGQIATTPLPLTEQIGLGANALVRGYTLDDGAFDAGFIVRNEVRTPSFAIDGRASTRVSPFVFTDGGWGRDVAANRGELAVSVGAGADCRLGPVVLGTSVGLPLRSVGRTSAGEARFSLRATARL